jgi:8-oxo-dGTP pyrophosphatase MutT (NUDIX family)
LPYPFSTTTRDGRGTPFDADAFEARLRHLSERRPYLFPRTEVPDHFRSSSVLICFWRDDGNVRVILTKRAETLSGHPGQMSFPGGRLEPGEDFVTAAVRETEEEVGVPRDAVDVLGRLDDAWSGAGHLLAPIVGWLDEAPTFSPNPAEVDEVHTPRIDHLMRRESYSEEEKQYGEQTYINPILTWDRGRIFGLSTDLLIEAIRWAHGEDVGHGATRLESLRSFLKERAVEDSMS